MNKIRLLFAFGVAIWAAMAGVGFVWLADYSSRPSVSAKVSPILPSGIFSETKNEKPKLVVFIHPRCQCGRAALDELARLVAENQIPVDIKIIFYRPDSASAKWIETDLLRTAQQIPNVAIGIMNETEIESFGIATSGQTIVYDSRGNIEFSGGITVSRGHEAKRIGRASIESILNGEEPLVRETSVFGCLLTSKAVEF